MTAERTFSIPHGKQGLRYADTYEWSKALRGLDLTFTEKSRDGRSIRTVKSATVKAVGRELATWASANGSNAYPGSERIAWATGETRRTVEMALRALHELGLIAQEKKPDRHRGKSAEWRLTLHDEIGDLLTVSWDVFQAAGRQGNAERNRRHRARARDARALLASPPVTDGMPVTVAASVTDMRASVTDMRASHDGRHARHVTDATSQHQTTPTGTSPYTDGGASPPIPPQSPPFAPHEQARAANAGPVRRGDQAVCHHCGGTFTAAGAGQRYCTPAHRDRASARRTAARKRRNANGPDSA